MQYKDLLSQMTLEEKCSLLSGGTQFTTKAVARLGIPAMYLSDGPHGVRRQMGAADHLGLNGSLPATCFPTAATVANSWDVELGEALGRCLGEEARAQRVNVLLGPGLNVKRTPLCGRNFEYFSEDPYLAGKMAAAYIRGIQSNGISACPKHFAVNSQEYLRMHSDSILDERTLREIYLTGFEIAVKEGKPHSLMSSYNRINGVYANENETLLQNILVDEWGFEGFVVSDWGASNDHALGVKAGSHLEMPTAGPASDLELIQAVRAGKLSEETLDRRVETYLRALSATEIPPSAPDSFDEAAHHEAARRAAAESIVLLKNEGDLLPLREGTKVAVLGDFALAPRYQGAGSSTVNATRVDTGAELLKRSGLDVVGTASGFRRHGGEDSALRSEAVALAEKADVVLLYLGLDEISESEGMDRTHLHINRNQVDLLEAVAAVNPSTVIVLTGGAPIELPWLDRCKAVLHGYLSGQAGAGAMADVITGRVNPSGKLAETYPFSYADTPAARYFPGKERTAEYREGIFVGYRYYATASVPVRFPFGFGLSYTTFAYSGLSVTPEGAAFTLTNTGSRAGAEAVQLYVSLPDSRIFRARRELKGFAKVRLEPGESRQVTIPFDDKAFRYFNTATGRWETEGGAYLIEIAASSEDIRLSASLEVPDSGAPCPYDREALSCYFSGQVAEVPDEQFAVLLGHAIPPACWNRTAPLELNDTFAQLAYAKGWVGRLVYRICKGQVDRAEARGKPDLDALFRYNMPFRGIAKMMGGAVDMPMSAALVEIFNGRFFKGLGHLITAWRRMRRGSRDLAAVLAREEK